MRLGLLSSGCLREDNNRNIKTVSPQNGRGVLQEVPTTVNSLGKLWCFGEVVTYGRRSLTRDGHWQVRLYPEPKENMECNSCAKI